MNRIVVLTALALAGCAGTNTSVSQGAYALTAGLDTAEKVAHDYETSGVADPAVVAQIKVYDAGAYALIAPLAANANNTTADEIAAAQAALTALTTYLTQHGATK